MSSLLHFPKASEGSDFLLNNSYLCYFRGSAFHSFSKSGFRDGCQVQPLTYYMPCNSHICLFSVGYESCTVPKSGLGVVLSRMRFFGPVLTMWYFSVTNALNSLRDFSFLAVTNKLSIVTTIRGWFFRCCRYRHLCWLDMNGNDALLNMWQVCWQICFCFALSHINST